MEEVLHIAPFPPQNPTKPNDIGVLTTKTSRQVVALPT